MIRYLKMLFFFFVSVFFLGCNSTAYKLSEDEKIVDRITLETAIKLKEKKNLILIGTGGRMMYEVEMLAMSFNYFQEVDKNTARELLVDSVEEYLSAINSNEDIRPYLQEYPFSAKNIEVAIFFRNPDGSEIAVGKINIAASDQGKIVYYTDDPENYSLKAIFRETYEEAKQAIISRANKAA